MNFRFANIADSEEILKIYAQYIDTPITFECELPTKDEFIKRVKGIMNNYPYILCVDKEKIIGYAYAHKQKEREAYGWNAELSVYIDKSFTSRGLGKKLYNIIIEILKMQGVKTIYAEVTLPNEKSEGLHRTLGFRKVVIYHNTGYKCGQWHDVTCFEKIISSYDKNPKSILSIGEIDDKKIKLILENFILPLV